MVDPKRRRAGRPFTGRVRLERGNWRVFLPGVGPSYISVGQFERNLERMDANRARAESLGAVRDGPALLAGLVVCGRCGKRMSVHYQHGPAGRLQPVYACDRDNIDHAGPRCQRLAGSCVDTAVTELLLAAIAPAALEVSLAAAEQVEAGREAVDRIWRARLERAEFTVDRARRQYQLAEPENRLVTRPRALTAAEREQIRALAADIPGIWHAPTTTDADRKQLLRALVEQVRVTVLGASEQVDVEIVWAGGHRTRTRIVRPVAKLTQLSYYPQLAARTRELVDGGHSLAQIAERLNAEGFRPPKRIPVFTPNAVTDLLRAL